MLNDDQFGILQQVSSQQLGNYRIVNTLANGGFASVYLGEHLYLKRLAAIKVLRTPLGEKEQARFLEEAKLLASLSHPHIVRVQEFAIAQRWIKLPNSRIKEQIPFLVMDYAPGGNLRTLYPPGLRVSLKTVVTVSKQVAEALQYAHDRQVIHRDIKPENLLIGERQEVMLSDFGLALFSPSSASISRQGMAGTLPYTAPEQLQGKPSFASDQYSMAILVYEWLCGSRPFIGEDLELIIEQISSIPPRLRSKNPSIPPAVEDVVLKALAKDPRQRYASVRDFVAALEAASQLFVSRQNTDPSPSIKIASITHAFPALTKGVPENSYFARRVETRPVSHTGELPAAAVDVQDRQQERPSAVCQRNRHRMLQKVRAFWVNGVLSQSLQGATFIPLGLVERQDAVESPWSSSIYKSEKLNHTFPPGTSITEVFDQAGGDLLILGEAGSGKTILLLELCRHLLDRAEHDYMVPIPVVFLLSSWAGKQQSLDEWLIEELYSKYQVPYALGELWIRQELILPLLDGLDEVPANLRPACITAINVYKNKYGLSSLVLCSRLTEYMLNAERVILHKAVVLEPLTMQQIEGYLKHSGKNFDSLLQALHASLFLQQLVTTPLMLNITTLVYEDKAPEDFWRSALPEEHSHLLFETYVDQMIQRYPAKFSQKPRQMKHWLGYLAYQMQQHGQTVFYLEQIQPDWIENRRWMQFYRWFAVLLPGALIGALTGILCNVLLFHAGSIGVVSMDAVYGTVMGYMFSGGRAQLWLSKGSPGFSERARQPFFKANYVLTMLFVGLVTFFCLASAKGLMAGLANGSFLGILSFPLSLFIQRSRKPVPPTRGKQAKKPKGKSPFPLVHLAAGVLVGLACGATSVITILVNQGLATTNFTFLLSLDVRDSLRNALLGTLLSLLLVRNDGIIHRAETLSWSWKLFWQSIKGFRKILFDVLVGLVIGVVFASKQLFQGNMSNVISAGLTTGLLIVVGMRLFYALWSGFSSSNLNDRQRYKPNEGIKRSLSHGLLGGIIGVFTVTFCSIVTSGIATLLTYGPSSLEKQRILLSSLILGLSNALLLGPVGGLLAGLLLGGLAYLQYSILRFVLWRTKRLPLHLLQLLEAATTSVLMHKAGGGYLFIHRFLRDYFASLDKKTPSPKDLERLVRHL